MLQSNGSTDRGANGHRLSDVRPILKRSLRAVLGLCSSLLVGLVLISQIGIPSIAQAENSTSIDAHPPSGGNFILSKTITWADGTNEQINLGQDHFFYLNGVKKQLIGVVLSTSGMPNGSCGAEFYLPENLAVYDKELDYLESVGVRLIHVDLRYMRWWAQSIADEDAAYSKLMDLIYQHKMLVIAEITGKSVPGFANLENPNFSWKVGMPVGQTVDQTIKGETDSMGLWAERWAGVVSRYENVVAVVAENELDLPYKAKDLWWLTNPTDQKYGTSEIIAYLTYIKGILNSKINAPIIHKLCGDLNLGKHPDFKLAALSVTDIPTFDCYSSTVSGMNSQLDELMIWLGQSGYPQTGWWCTELNAG